MKVNKDRMSSTEGNKELGKAINKAFKEMMDSLKNEPSSILLYSDGDNETEDTIDDITSWLFRRRSEDGDTSN